MRDAASPRRAAPELLDALAEKRHAAVARSDDDAAAPTDRGYRVQNDVAVEVEIPLA